MLVNDTQHLVRLIEQVTGGINTLDELLSDQVDRRLHHPEALTLAVAKILEAQYAIEDLLPRLRSARRTLRRVGQLLATEAAGDPKPAPANMA